MRNDVMLSVTSRFESAWLPLRVMSSGTPVLVAIPATVL